MAFVLRREGKVAVALFALFFAALLPPAVGVANSTALVGGHAALYLWATAWGLFVIAALVWAAKRDALGITEDQVPPELREREDVVTAEEGR